MPSVAWRIDVFGQVVKMTPMQLREYLDFSCRKTVPRAKRRVADWSSRLRSKHITDVTCEYWKADDIGQSFDGFPFRNPDRKVRHGSQMWFYSPPSHTKLLRDARHTKPTPATDRLQRLEDALAHMQEQYKALDDRVEKMSENVDKIAEDVSNGDDWYASSEDHILLQNEVTDLKRDLDRAQLRGANGDLVYT